MELSEKFWIIFWMDIAISILAIASIICGTIYMTGENTSKVVSEAIQKGTDPIVARCAMLIGSSLTTADTAICLSATTKK